AYKTNSAADSIIDKVADTNKEHYVTDKTKSLADALVTNDEEDISVYSEELEEANASASTVRKQLTAYFKPLYIEAYENDDEDTMEMIEDILTDINATLNLPKKITEYTDKKDFSKWIESPNASDDDDEDDDDYSWLE
ncbi:MAG: hypothetical protein J6W60_09930, partial [Treponema sp.]|nr:hypothetical protein [Treponema sp.]